MIFNCKCFFTLLNIVSGLHPFFFWYSLSYITLQSRTIVQTINVGSMIFNKKEKNVPESCPLVSDLTTKKTLYAFCMGYCVRAQRSAKSSAVEKPNKQWAAIFFIILSCFKLYLRSISFNLSYKKEKYKKKVTEVYFSGVFCGKVIVSLPNFIFLV